MRRFCVAHKGVCVCPPAFGPPQAPTPTRMYTVFAVCTPSLNTVPVTRPLPPLRPRPPEAGPSPAPPLPEQTRPPAAPARALAAAAAAPARQPAVPVPAPPSAPPHSPGLPRRQQERRCPARELALDPACRPAGRASEWPATAASSGRRSALALREPGPTAASPRTAGGAANDQHHRDTAEMAAQLQVLKILF